MKKTISIILLTLLVINCCYSQDEESPIEVSLEQLIHHSKKYNKQYVSVQGNAKFNKSGSGSKIFNTKENLQKNNLKNCIAFIFKIESSSYRTVESCDERHITLTGFYNCGEIYDSNHRKLKNGILTSVRGIKLIDNK